MIILPSSQQYQFQNNVNITSMAIGNVQLIKHPNTMCTVHHCLSINCSQIRYLQALLFECPPSYQFNSTILRWEKHLYTNTNTQIVMTIWPFVGRCSEAGESCRAEISQWRADEVLMFIISFFQSFPFPSLPDWRVRAQRRRNGKVFRRLVCS